MTHLMFFMTFEVFLIAMEHCLEFDVPSQSKKKIDNLGIN